ncbi:MAG: multidrug effflux MFS transporter [Pseudomonadota bacterium]
MRHDPNTPAAQRIPPFWLLVLITLGGTMAMHMVVPALPDAARSLHVVAGEMQMAISIYIVGLACGQLFYGPLSDALGRRPVLMAGLCVYIAGSVAVLFAPDLNTVIAGRLVQALGGGAGIALGRAIVRETTPGDAALSRLALLNVMVVMGPGFAPMVGGAIAASWGWRAIFIALSAVGALTFWLTWVLLPETTRPTRQFGVSTLLRNYATLLRSRRFAGFALGSGCAVFSVYAFLAAAPFIFINELHQPVHLVGIYAGLMIFGTALGNAMTVRLARKLSGDKLLRLGNNLNIAASGVLLAIVLLGQLNVYNAVGGMLVYTCGSGLLNPVALGKAINVDARLIGSAAGLFGCIQLAVGGASIELAALGGNPAVSALAVLFGAAVVARVAFAFALASEPAPQ